MGTHPDDPFTHARPERVDLTFTVDSAPADHDALAERIRAAGARAWAQHRAQPGTDDVPVADDGEHGDVESLRRAALAANAGPDRAQRRAAFVAYLRARWASRRAR